VLPVIKKQFVSSIKPAVEIASTFAARKETIDESIAQRVAETARNIKDDAPGFMPNGTPSAASVDVAHLGGLSAAYAIDAMLAENAFASATAARSAALTASDATATAVERFAYRLATTQANPEIMQSAPVYSAVHEAFVRDAKLDYAILKDLSHGYFDYFPPTSNALEFLWHTGEPVWFKRAAASIAQTDAPSLIPTEVSPPAIVVVWDPELINAQEYKELVTAIGDLVRESGGVGVQRIQSATIGVHSTVEV
jgi:hypothetical protein